MGPWPVWETTGGRNHITTGHTECHPAWDYYLICAPSSLFLLPIQLWPAPTGWSFPAGGGSPRPAAEAARSDCLWAPVTLSETGGHPGPEESSSLREYKYNFQIMIPRWGLYPWLSPLLLVS